MGSQFEHDFPKGAAPKAIKRPSQIIERVVAIHNRLDAYAVNGAHKIFQAPPVAYAYALKGDLFAQQGAGWTGKRKPVEYTDDGDASLHRDCFHRAPKVGASGHLKHMVDKLLMSSDCRGNATSAACVSLCC